MNKIVRPLYPVDRLPEELRKGLPEHGWVRIEITEAKPDPNPVSLVALVGSVHNVHGTEEEVLAHIEELRQDR